MIKKLFFLILIVTSYSNLFSKVLIQEIDDNHKYWKRLKITYKGKLAKDYRVVIHYGVNNWNFLKDKMMEMFYDKDGTVGHKVELNIDKFNSKVNFCFFGIDSYDIKNKHWDNNKKLNWEVPVNKSRFMNKSLIIKNGVPYLRVYYFSKELKNEKLFLHFGSDNWKNLSDVRMTKLKNIYFADILISENIKEINYCFFIKRGDGTKIWDNNLNNNWKYSLN